MGKFLARQIGVLTEIWIVNRVRTICALNEATMKPHTIVFENKKDAAMINTASLEKCNNSYDDLLETQRDTILTPGS